MTIEAGSATATVVVTPIDDAAFESNETVVLTLSPKPPTASARRAQAPSRSSATTFRRIWSCRPCRRRPPQEPTRTSWSPTRRRTRARAARRRRRPASICRPTRPGCRGRLAWQPAGGCARLRARQMSCLDHAARPAVDRHRLVLRARKGGLGRRGQRKHRDQQRKMRAARQDRPGPDRHRAHGSRRLPPPARTISVSDTTKNQGGGAAAASTTRFYWSTNTSLDASDQIIGSRSVPPLAPGASSSVTTTLTVPATAAAGTVLRHCPGRRCRRSAGNDGDQQHQGERGGEGRTRPDRDRDVRPATAAAGAHDYRDRHHEESRSRAGGRVVHRILPVREFDRHRPTTSSAAGRSVSLLAGDATASTLLQIPADIAPAATTSSAGPTGTAPSPRRRRPTTPEPAEHQDRRRSGGGRAVGTRLGNPMPITVTDSTRNQGLAPVPESGTGFYLSSNTLMTRPMCFSATVHGRPRTPATIPPRRR